MEITNVSLELHNLGHGGEGNKKSRRIGRGPGSGHGKTAGKGHKGQKSRSGYSKRAGFEGGQMPLYRRVPKRGFRNIFAKKAAVLNVGDLNRLEEGTSVSLEALKEQGVVAKKFERLRILGKGTLEKKLDVKAHHFSESARKSIEKAGGSVEVQT